MTPEFQGTHLWDRLGWAKENLEPVQTEYCIVWEDPETPDEPAKVTHLLHNTKPIKAMTEEQAIEYLIMKDIPSRVWQNEERSNRPRMIICTKKQLPQKRIWRNAWKIAA